MDHLPLHDTPMLVSAINFLLRDEEFDNLDQICYHFNVDREELLQDTLILRSIKDFGNRLFVLFMNETYQLCTC